MEKKDCLRLLSRAIKLYKKNLLGKVFLIIYQIDNKVNYLELYFSQTNLLHLTGLKYKYTAKDFYSRLASHRLCADDFDFDDNGFAELKLQVLERLFRANLSATMIGEFNGHRPTLLSDKLVGGVNACLGLNRLNNGKYCPVTCLNTNIKDDVTKAAPILRIYVKKYSEELYKTSVYCSKKENVPTFPDDLLKKLDTNKLNATSTN